MVWGNAHSKVAFIGSRKKDFLKRLFFPVKGGSKFQRKGGFLFQKGFLIVCFFLYEMGSFYGTNGVAIKGKA